MNETDSYGKFENPPQIITDGAGNELGVFLTTGDFEKLLEELEELEDTKAYDEAKSRTNVEFIPFSQAMEETGKI